MTNRPQSQHLVSQSHVELNRRMEEELAVASLDVVPTQHRHRMVCNMGASLYEPINVYKPDTGEFLGLKNR